MSYIERIIDIFFKNDISGSLKSRVYKRLLYPLKDEKRDKALQKIWDDLDTTNQEEDWESSFSKMEPLLSDGARKQKKISISRRWIEIAAIWTIPLLMFCSSVYMYWGSDEPLPTSSFEEAYLQYYAPIGSSKQIILPDSSRVWLNAGSTLLCPSSFSASERKVHLIGEGFFDVKKDNAHPFIVNTQFLKMQVLGTSFNVSSYPEDPNVTTTLETGALKINIQNDTVSYLLHPDSQLVYNHSSNTIKQMAVRAADYSEWRNGGLFLDSFDFYDAMKIIGRTYGKQIHIRTSAYKGQKIYVHFNKGESIENIFYVLKLMIPEMEYSIKGDRIFIE